MNVVPRNGFLVRLLLICVLSAAALASGSAAGADAPREDPAGQPIPPDDPRWDWWRDARFGMFLHWGPVSLKGTEISWSRAGERRDRHEMAGGIPAEDYDNLYRKFDPEKFDAKKWVAIAKAAGMRYMVLVAKHHDGFCMFDSKLTDYKITNAPFQRDICADFARACREAGMRFGFYFSPPDWHHADFFTARHHRFVEDMHGQVRELLTNYGRVDILWFDWDAGLNSSNTPETWGNAALFPMIRKLQPEILLTKRCGGWGDFNSPEQTVGGFDNKAPWETCMTICRQWSWKPDDDMKPLKECLQSLIRCAGGDGNFLLNVGPMPTGEIEPRQAARLEEMGGWLARYGESIYGTRGGPYRPSSWGTSTCKGKVAYLHVFRWDGNDVVLPAPGRNILKAEVLTGGTVTIARRGELLALTVPAQDHQDIDTIIKLELDGPAAEIEPLP